VKIWIDLANSPQVLFFRPIIPELERRGHCVTITSRNYAQTSQLADHYGLQHTVVGGHGSKRLYSIAHRILERAWNLLRFARSQGFDLAVSHNSYAQAVAAFMLRIPFVTTMDYEHQPANHLCFRLAREVIVPDSFPQWALHKYGAKPQKTVHYHGLKEQVYLADFTPQRDYLASLGIPEDRVVVVMRPPGDWGLYHNFDNPLFEGVLDHVAKHPKTYIIFLPRITSQAEAARSRGYENLLVSPTALDGPNLLYHADLVISGGGTMNREAAVLGTPAYSVFKGKLAAVDRYLMEQGRMEHISDDTELSAIEISKKKSRAPLLNKELVNEITDAITRK